jgi:ArsR family transcriptional regulator
MTLTPDSLFRALGDPTRLRALLLLEHCGELCVCELTHALAISQPKISRHLAILRDAGIVTDRRVGHWVYYRLHPALPDWGRRVIATTAGGVGHAAPFADDQAVLGAMPNRPDTSCCA